MPLSTPSTGAGSRMWNPGVQLLESRRMDLDRAGWNLDLCSPFWRIYVNQRSGAYLEHEGKRNSIRGNELWVIPEWVRFQTGLNRPVVQDYLHFTFAGLPTFLLRQHFTHPTRIRPTESIRLLIAQWRQTIDLIGSPAHLCSAGALAHAIMAQLLANWEQAPARRWLAQTTEIRTALDCLETALAEPPNNRVLGQLCGMSEDHFIRRFRQIMNVTPADYGRQQRIAAAAEWLTGTNRTLEDIADATGFTDRFHFSRVFKQRLGLTPAAYRKIHRLEG